jgi:integrase
MSGSYVREQIKRLGIKAGISKRVHAHGLRHTHAFELMMEGIPISIIQRQLGHASLATTDTYLAHIAPKHVIDAISARSWTPRQGARSPALPASVPAVGRRHRLDDAPRLGQPVPA